MERTTSAGSSISGKTGNGPLISSELALGVRIELILGADQEIVETRARAPVGVFDDAKGLGEEYRPDLGNKSAVGGGSNSRVEGVVAVSGSFTK
jgi:hypothetical protein